MSMAVGRISNLGRNGYDAISRIKPHLRVRSRAMLDHVGRAEMMAEGNEVIYNHKAAI